MASVRFKARIRYWNADTQSGLAVADIPAASVAPLGGRRQARVSGAINGKPFTGTTMLVRGGGFCVSVTKAALRSAGVSPGDTAVFELEPATR